MGTLIVAAIVFLLVCALLKALIAGKVGGGGSGSYEALPSLLTPAEQAFYRCLRQAVGDSATICPKVRLADIIRPQKQEGRKGYYAAFNKIAAKHVDFVCVHPATMKVIGVIELDDKTHEQSSRKGRDRFVDAALLGASIPISHIQAKRNYDINALTLQLSSDLRLSLSSSRYYR